MKVVGVLSCAVLAAATLPTKEIVPGVNMPAVNIGTWLAGSKTEDPKVIVSNWLGQGFRGVDTALVYNDQADVASAIEESGVAREEIFITTKIPGCAAAAASVKQDLKALNVDYIDLMLIHSPIGLSCPNTWKELEKFVATGQLKSIGVSNFNVKQMQNVMAKATVPIAVNQIEYNVFSHDEEIIAFCDANNITVEAYSPLSGANGAQSVFADETVKSIAATHNVSAAQVALRWIVQRGHTLAVLTSNAAHQASDADLWSFELADEEMDTLTQHQNNFATQKSCSGTTDPVFTEPQCYHGSAGALGLTESVDVKLVDFASSAGHINVAGDGIAGFTCDNHDFTKSGQAITTDLSDCQPDGISISKVLYCSDQDTIKVTVKADAVPIPISTQLTRVDCASRQAGASCSGTADPDVSSPRCYHGKGGALGLTENVDIKISDFSGGAGHIDVAGDGIEGFTCSNHDFTKSGQAISTDLSDCQPDGITISKVLYCSDQDTVKVTVKDQTVPIPVTATLKKVDCASAVVV